MSIILQRRRRHFKSGQATATKRSLMHVNEGGAVTHGKGELAWDTWPNRLVLRPSLQSGHETNDQLKSGPAKAGPAELATPPLYFLRTSDCHYQLRRHQTDISMAKTV